MFLRLKTRNEGDVSTARYEINSDDEWLSSSLRQNLYDRLITTFDWHCGVTHGAIQFIDIQLVEYCSHQAQRANSMFSAMLRRIMEFSSGLMDPVTGAFHHYQTRLNDETRRGPATLLGQAIGLRACTLGYGRTSLAPVLGDAIIEYVEQTLTNHHGLLNLDALGPHAFAQWRLHHYYWYLVAAHEYCVLRERDGLADALAATANGILTGSQTPCVSGQIIATPGYLDEAVALAALAEYFLPDLAIANKSTVVARFINALNAFRIADGGYSNEPITARQRDAIVDIDLTIEIVRLATRFAMGDNPDRWRAIQHHGLRALSQPAVALARPIEAGILLIDEELRESTGPCGAVAHQQQTFEVPPKSLKQLRFHPPQ